MVRNQAETIVAKVIVDSCVLINSFQSDSEHRNASVAFIDHFVRHDLPITMPAHGWFEVLCNVRRLSAIDRNYLHPVFLGSMQLPLELIHIDAQFISKYGNVSIPYTKAADHIFIVVALVNKYPLVSWDDKMLKIGKEVGLKVYKPSEYISLLQFAE